MTPEPTQVASPAFERWHSIGDAARILGISVPTIRLYEREGLILPFRRPSGHRIFSDSDLERIRCLRRTINEKKISIAGIRTLLSMVPCWALKGCPPEERSACEALTTTAGPCWAMRAKPPHCAAAECRECVVYLHASDCAPLKRAIARLTLAHAPFMSDPTS